MHKNLFCFLKDGIRSWLEYKKNLNALKGIFLGKNGHLSSPILLVVEAIVDEGLGGKFDRIIFTKKCLEDLPYSIKFIKEGEEIFVDNMPNRVLSELWEQFNLIIDISSKASKRIDGHRFYREYTIKAHRATREFLVSIIQIEPSENYRGKFCHAVENVLCDLIEEKEPSSSALKFSSSNEFDTKLLHGEIEIKFLDLCKKASKNQENNPTPPKNKD